MNSVFRISAITLSLLLWAGFGAAATAETGETIPARAEGLLVTLTATVEAVDLKARTVDLKREDGEIVTIDAGDEVRNLDQVKVGDIVEVDYYEVMVTALEPSATGVRERIERVETERADPGEKPAGAVTRTVEIVATVTALDSKERLATLKGPESTITVLVDDDVDLTKIKVGDDVRAVYQESIAVRVMAPASK